VCFLACTGELEVSGQAQVDRTELLASPEAVQRWMTGPSLEDGETHDDICLKGVSLVRSDTLGGPV
jgi:hypothetical protein